MQHTRMATRRPLRVEPLEARDVFNAADPVTCAFPPPPDPPAAFAAAPDAAPPAPLEDTFLLHSSPTATKSIYLDFDGHTTTRTYWNRSFGSSFDTPAFNFEGSAATFSAAERATIQYIWQRVAEDFAPFDVDVTTQDPGMENLIDRGGADARWGTRVSIGGKSQAWFHQSAGGVAFVGSFGNTFGYANDNPAFVFAETQYNNESYIVLAASHEIGHTLGLSHDGKGAADYYGGHANWAPIMGAGYNKAITQWSRGEYPGATNHENDLAVITTQNGFGYRTDDFFDTTAAATAVTLSAPTAFTAAGVIEKPADVDVMKFSPGFGPFTVTASPAARDPNLNIQLDLLNAAGDVVATASPANSLGAKLSATIEEFGPYYLRVSGVGQGTAATGYTDYGSLGQYSLVATMSEYAPPVLRRVTGVTATESTGGAVTAFRVTFDAAVDAKTLKALTAKVTGPAGAAVKVVGVRAVPGTSTAVDVLISPQKFAGTGGVRVAFSPRGPIALDMNGNGAPGELGDYYAAAAFQFNSTAGGPIADNATTDFSLNVGRAFNIRDVNVRVNLTHANVSDLALSLVAPDGVTEIRLFDHRGGTGNNLANTHFDEQSTKSLVGAKAPFNAAVYKPDFDLTTLAALNGTSSAGDWTLRVTDSAANGFAGQLISWGLTFATAEARDAVAVTAVTPVPVSSSAFASLVKSFTVQFDRPMNADTVKAADFKVTFGPKNTPVKILSVAGAGTTFTVTTAPWTKAGAYTIKVGPAVADTLGNGMDGTANGFFLEPGDVYATTAPVTRNVYQSTTAAKIPDGRSSLTSSVTVADKISIEQIAVDVNIRHANVGDLRLTLISPTGAAFVLVSNGVASGADFTHTTFTAEAAAGIATGAAPYTGDFTPEAPMGLLIGLSAKGTWKLKVEDMTGGNAGQLLSWGIYVKPAA